MSAFHTGQRSERFRKNCGCYGYFQNRCCRYEGRGFLTLTRRGVEFFGALGGVLFYVGLTKGSIYWAFVMLSACISCPTHCEASEICTRSAYYTDGPIAVFLIWQIRRMFILHFVLIKNKNKIISNVSWLFKYILVFLNRYTCTTTGTGHRYYGIPMSYMYIQIVD